MVARHEQLLTLIFSATRLKSPAASFLITYLTELASDTNWPVVRVVAANVARDTRMAKYVRDRAFKLLEEAGLIKRHAAGNGFVDYWLAVQGER